MDENAIDAALTRSAVDELLREMKRNQTFQSGTKERKVNPLGKRRRPNNGFLKRTLNSIKSYNRRKNERTREICKRKLKELNDRRPSRMKERFVGGRHNKSSSIRRRSRSHSSQTNFRSYETSKRSTMDHKTANKKRRRKRRRQKTTCSSKSKCVSDFENVKCERVLEMEQQSYFEDNEHYMESCANAASLTFHSHMQQLLHYQQQVALLAVNKAAIHTNENVQNIDNQLKKLPLPSSSSSSTSALSVSSLEEDENGVLTINLSSDDDILQPSKNVKSKRRSSKSDSSIEFQLDSSSSSIDESHKDYDKGVCVTIDSDSSDTKFKCKNSVRSNSVTALTCSSDNDTNLVSESAVQSPNKEILKKIENSSNEMIDLTAED